MSYEPTTWVTGDIITATKLNNIESGVQSVSSSYTPTTWATGDIITAVKLNNIEQGIANAGGGSSDFSTATVTVVNNTNVNYTFSGAFFYSDEQIIDSELYAERNGTTTGDIIIKNNAVSALGFDSVPTPDKTVAIAGNITESVAFHYEVTGDCTITVS